MRAGTLLAAFLFAAAPALAMARKPRMDKSMVTNGAYCKIDKPGHRIIRTAAEWKALWNDIGRPAPTVDLAHNFAVAVFAGTRSSGGFGIVFDEPKKEGETLVIRYKITSPKGMATMALTQPFSVRLFPKTDKPISLVGSEQ